VDERRIDLCVDPSELDRRRAGFVQPSPQGRGWGSLHARSVLPSNLGADLDFLAPDPEWHIRASRPAGVRLSRFVNKRFPAQSFLQKGSWHLLGEVVGFPRFFVSDLVWFLPVGRQGSLSFL
jgi:hypothetical protein